MTKEFPVARITSNGTVSPVKSDCFLAQIVIAIASAGTPPWTLKIQDKATSPNVIVAAYTVAVPSDGKPTILKFDEPIFCAGGVDIITAGSTPGQLSVWIAAFLNKTT